MKRSGAVSVVILLLLGCGPQNNAQRAISKGAKAMKPNVTAVTVDVPVARNRPWPMPGVVATGLNKALTGLRAGSTLTVRLSVPRDAGTNPGMELIGTVDVESGILTVRTECGCFEFLPNSRFRVKDLKGNVTTSGEIEPAGQNPVDIWAQFGRAAKMTAEGPVRPRARRLRRLWVRHQDDRPRLTRARHRSGRDKPSASVRVNRLARLYHPDLYAQAATSRARWETLGSQAINRCSGPARLDSRRGGRGDRLKESKATIRAAKRLRGSNRTRIS